jgi:hypothetical protein
MGKVSVTCPNCNHMWFRKPSQVEEAVGLMGGVTVKEKLYIMSKYCALCHKAFKNIDEATIDHIHPKSKGGADNWRNYQLAHKICNVKKGDKIL